MKIMMAWAAAVALSAGIALAPSNAAAAVEGGTGEVQLYLGWEWPDTEKDDLDDMTFGVRGGYNVNPHFGIELSVGYFDSSANVPAPGSDIDATAWFTDLSFVWQANPDDRAVFLLYAGPGWTNWDFDIHTAGFDGGDSSISGHLGLAGKFYATDRVFVRADGRWRFFDFDNDYTDDSVNDYEATLAIGWTIGGK